MIRKFYNAEEKEMKGGGPVTGEIKDSESALKELNRLQNVNTDGITEAEPLGHAQTAFDKKLENDSNNMAVAMDTGWMLIDKANLPSKGEFYPADFVLSIRSASVPEIKHYSSMREDDWVDVDDKIMQVIGKCCKVVYGGSEKKAVILKDADKLYILFTIRDLTMKEQGRENKLHMTPQCPHCGINHKIELVNNVFGFYTTPKAIKQYYNEDQRCFVVPVEANGDTEDMKFYVPNMGVSNWIKKYIFEKERAKARGEDGSYYDQQALSFIQFLVNGPNAINEARIKQLTNEINNEWSLEKMEVAQIMVTQLQKAIKPNITVTCLKKEGNTEVGCGKEFSTPITFPKGIRHLLNITGISSKLFGDIE